MQLGIGFGIAGADNARDPHETFQHDLLVHGRQLEVHAIRKDLLANLLNKTRYGEVERLSVIEVGGKQYHSLEILQVVIRQNVLFEMDGRHGNTARTGSR